MKLAGYRLRQRDGISCGPTVAVVAAALLDDGYRSRLQTGPGWFGTEQDMVHRLVNRVWPRRLGMTPPGVAAVIADRCAVPCRWRVARGLLPGRVDAIADVLDAVRAGAPVPMLIGQVIPRHWVLIVSVTGERLRCFDPASGELREVTVSAVRQAQLEGLGFGRPFAFVLPIRPGPRCAPQRVEL
ncbi:hypothetical protein O6072_25005 [Mycolicibacterium neoaurum]|uniref:hypothetical protein n=1 Tax=Mycolicibacterium neoaurum TaxID=1795 RepID=UPI00248CDA8D|nr:hypothetical protein [Mycolicibacterium neoaurum]WBP92940.1 hypothetical protein O7W24_17370 [Mycolicibacterium neoaurum]WBS08028.1 hypothetical protein O6072_25005 [Mycolicibacterium neoaurum]